MNTQDTILAIVSASGKIEGRKRLQKMVHLLKVGGTDVPARFRIHHFGPFSEDVASTADQMVFEGALEEEVEAAGPYNTFLYLYSTQRHPSVDPTIGQLIRSLNAFSTVDLEVASTIAFFEEEGSTHRDAIQQTKTLKPTKTTTRVLAKAEEILSLLHEQ